MEKKYDCGGKTYVQRPLVWGQWMQLMDVLKDIQLPNVIEPAVLINVLKDRLMPLLAIVLTEEGQPVKGKDLSALADELSFVLTPDQIFDVVSDFFDINPMHSLLEKLKNASGKMGSLIGSTEALTKESSSSEPLSISQQETSGAETK